MKKNAKLQKLIMTVTYPEGERETNVFDGSMIEAIFFNTPDIRQSVESYYHSYEYSYGHESNEYLYGRDENVTVKDKLEQQQMVAGLVEEGWNMENKMGILPSCVILNRDGLPEIPQSSLCLSKKGRPQITGLNAGLVYPDGRQTWVPLHAVDLEDLQWMDRSMLENLH